MNGDLKKIFFLLIFFSFIMTFSGITLAFFNWKTNDSQKTNIVASVPNVCAVSVDGGGNIDSSSISIMPSTCTNTNNAIIKEIDSNIYFVDSDMPIQLKLSLKINSISEELTESVNFKYAITDSSMDCINDVIASGSFNGKKANDIIELTSNIYTQDDNLSNKYYLYIWLDKEESDIDTAGTSFDVKLIAQCTADTAFFSPVSPNPPVLDDGLIPVTISNNGVVTTVNKSDNTWYNYLNKKWANAILVSDSSRNSYLNTSGKVVLQSDILAYYVWIPRFKYKIWSSVYQGGSDEQEIDIIFEGKETVKSNGTNVGEYLTHPAFTFGDEELSGFWVGKFETTGNASQPTILPNVTSLRNQDVNNQFQTSLKFSGGVLLDGDVNFLGSNVYGLSKDINSHMMKNNEWGAVAYLSHSKYGINEEIRLNNNSNYITGCGASVLNGSSTSICELAYGSGTLYPQSSTGNITGIYDMSGGASEYVMGNYGGTSGNSGISIFPENNYFNLYSNEQFTNNDNTNMSLCTLATCGGDALYETSNWYDDSNGFINLNNPWFRRGGNFYDGLNAGIFNINADNGAASFYTFRSVLFLSHKENQRSYTISFNINGGTGSVPDDIIQLAGESSIIDYSIPSREGYTFSGWNTKQDGSGTTYYSGGTISVDKDTELYAKWSSSQSVPTLILLSSSVDVTITSPVSTSISYMYTGDGVLLCDSSNPNIATCSVDTDSSKVNITVLAEGSTSVILYANGTDNYAAVYKTISVDAVLETYNISYNSCGGDVTPPSQVKKYGQTLKLSSAIPSKGGYEFLGWSTADSCSSATSAIYASGSNYTVNEGDTLYAVWNNTKQIPNLTLSTTTLNISIASSSGSASASYSYNGDGEVSCSSNNLNVADCTVNNTNKTINVISRSSGSATITIFSSETANYATASKSIAVTSVIAPVNYVIMFDKNGGTGSIPSNIVQTAGSSSVIGNASLTKEGYTFDGWNTKQNGTGVTYYSGDSITVDKDTTLYAKWVSNKQKPSLILLSSSVNLTITTSASTSISYMYGGDGELMCESSDSNVAICSVDSEYDILDITALSEGSATITLYSAETSTYAAVYKTINVNASLKTYNISYNSCGGDVTPSSQIKKYGQALVLSSVVPVKNGYTFLGWSNADSCSSATSVAYNAGSSYMGNENKTLYAVWG